MSAAPRNWFDVKHAVSIELRSICAFGWSQQLEPTIEAYAEAYCRIVCSARDTRPAVSAKDTAKRLRSIHEQAKKLQDKLMALGAPGIVALSRQQVPFVTAWSHKPDDPNPDLVTATDGLGWLILASQAALQEQPGKSTKGPAEDPRIAEVAALAASHYADLAGRVPTAYEGKPAGDAPPNYLEFLQQVLRSTGEQGESVDWAARRGLALWRSRQAAEADRIRRAVEALEE